MPDMIAMAAQLNKAVASERNNSKTVEPTKIVSGLKFNQTTMVRSILSLAIATALSTLGADATTVAVVEMGKKSVLHPIPSSSPTASTGGVMSFWRSTHDAGANGKARKERVAQYPGMTVVPDLFSRADGGIVIGITGEVDLAAMPTVASVLEKDGAVGHFHLEGKNEWKLMNQLDAPAVVPADFDHTVHATAKAVLSDKVNELKSLSVNVKSKDDASKVDASIGRMLKALAADAEKAGSSVVIHFVVDDSDKNVHRRLLAEGEQRKLEDEGGNNNNGDNEDSFEIPYYEDEDGNQVTNWRTMFQIQYYNIVLWTSVGLFSILFTANMMTMTMPLMPDTLLFGESAKMVAE
jgi:hypothetical protein